MVRRISIIALFAFVLHLAWEYSHVSLYSGYENLTRLPVPVWAAFGDALYTLGAYLFIALIKHDADWLTGMTKRDIPVLASIGFFIALFVEYKALALGRWYYLPGMPIIDGLGVGASPVVQMSVLLPLTFVIARRMLQSVHAAAAHQ